MDNESDDIRIAIENVIADVEKLDSIKSEIMHLQSTLFRGPCFYKINDTVYYTDSDGMLCNGEANAEFWQYMELVEVRYEGTDHEERYYMLNVEITKQEREIYEWLKINHPVFSITCYISMHSINPEIVFLEKAEAIMADFINKFPKKSIEDFLKYMKIMDNIYKKKLLKNKKEWSNDDQKANDFE